MPTPGRGHVVMHFGDGSTIDTWQGITLKENFTDPLGSLTFTAAPPRNQYADYRRRLAKGELVTVLINGVNQGGFLIQTADRTVSKVGGCVIEVECKSVLITPYQGHVDPDLSLKYQNDVGIEEAILAALGPYGFDRVSVDAKAHAAATAGVKILGRSKGASRRALADLKHNQAVAQENETAYQFVTRIVTRLGAVLRVAFDGQLLVCVPDYDQLPVANVAQVFGRGVGSDVDMFIERVHIHDSNDEQFSECTVRGQRSDTVGQTSTQRPVATVSEAELHPNRPSYSSFAAAYKPKILRDKNSRDPQRAKSMAEFELGVRAINAFSVTGEVDGLIARTGAIWTVATMVHVTVEAEELDEDMFLLERIMRIDSNGGQRTELKLIPKGALVLGEPPTG